MDRYQENKAPSQYQKKHPENLLAVPTGNNLGDGCGSFGYLTRFLSQRSLVITPARRHQRAPT